MHHRVHLQDLAEGGARVQWQDLLAKLGVLQSRASHCSHGYSRLQSQAAKPEAIVTGQSRRVQVEPQLTMTSRTATVDKPNESRNSAH